jgi:hypothetical protein
MMMLGEGDQVSYRRKILDFLLATVREGLRTEDAIRELADRLVQEGAVAGPLWDELGVTFLSYFWKEHRHYSRASSWTAQVQREVERRQALEQEYPEVSSFREPRKADAVEVSLSHLEAVLSRTVWFVPSKKTHKLLLDIVKEELPGIIKHYKLQARAVATGYGRRIKFLSYVAEILPPGQTLRQNPHLYADVIRKKDELQIPDDDRDIEGGEGSDRAAQA